MASLPPRDQIHLWLRYQVVGYIEKIVHGFEQRLKTIFGRQLGGVRRSMTWRQFILALGLHTAEEMVEDGFGAYWLGSERLIPYKGDLSDYWVAISSGRDFLRGASSYTYIRDLVWRLCHRHAEERKSGAWLSRGHFIRRLAHHFGLAPKDAPAVDEGAQADPTPVHAPQPLPPPSPAGRTMP
ncbi:hypothetical protein Tco_0218028 [Tanacetum coccineum]